MVTAILGTILEHDQRLFDHITGPLGDLSGKTRNFLRLVSHLGDGHLWVMLGLGVLFTQGLQGRRAFGAGLAACLIAVLFFKLIKNRVARVRPGQNQIKSARLLLPMDKYSFPSGHSATSLAFALSVGFFFPSACLTLVCLSLLISMSRVALKVHFPLDIAAGWLLGLVSAAAGVIILG